MRSFVLRRLLQSALLLWALMTFTFVLTRVTPGGPDAVLLDQPKLGPEAIERLRERFGLNDPLPIAYAKWLGSALTLDFGRSYHYLRPPLDVMSERVWPTVQLGTLAYLIAMCGIPLGVTAAFHRGKALDMIIRVLTIVGDSVPHWWLGLLLIVALGALVGWIPQGQGTGGPWDWFAHIIVPAMILGLGGVVAFTRYVRSQVLEVLPQDYVRTARALGLPEIVVTTQHILRNSLMPVVTLTGGLLPALISGAAITEGIFNWPGMGRLYLEAAATRDYPLLLAIITVLTLATLLGTLMADILYGLVDPRVRYR